MVVGAPTSPKYRRPINAATVLGNAMGTGMLAQLFGRSFSDILSGYQVLSRRSVKSFPVLSAGFEIETETSVHAVELRMPVSEVMTAYRARAEGSTFKSSTYRHGWRILTTIATFFMLERPILLLGSVGGLLLLLARMLAIPLFITYAHTGLAPRFPTALISMG